MELYTRMGFNPFRNEFVTIDHPDSPQRLQGTKDHKVRSITTRLKYRIFIQLTTVRYINLQRSSNNQQLTTIPHA
ncbi:MAG: hypothetical protein IPM92_00590 [Saprospiraceae bacterium]|nr:hypothetical protein [Saprospiraceae bacterium]